MNVRTEEFLKKRKKSLEAPNLWNELVSEYDMKKYLKLKQNKRIIKKKLEYVMSNQNKEYIYGIYYKLYERKTIYRDSRIL